MRFILVFVLVFALCFSLPAQEKSGKAVETKNFTAVGSLEVDVFELETDYGRLIIPKYETKRLIGGKWADEQKEFELKAIREWFDTGIVLKEGDRLKVTAGGLLDYMNESRC